MKNNKCIFFRETARGTRCILQSPEDWYRLKDRLIEYCMNGGKGCPYLGRYMRVKEKMRKSRVKYGSSNY